MICQLMRDLYHVEATQLEQANNISLFHPVVAIVHATTKGLVPPRLMVAAFMKPDINVGHASNIDAA